MHFHQSALSALCTVSTLHPHCAHTVCPAFGGRTLLCCQYMSRLESQVELYTSENWRLATENQELKLQVGKLQGEVTMCSCHRCLPLSLNAVCCEAVISFTWFIHYMLCLVGLIFGSRRDNMHHITHTLSLTRVCVI